MRRPFVLGKVGESPVMTGRKPNLEDANPMTAARLTSVEIPTDLLKQAKSAAAHLNLAQNELVQMALAQFIEQVQSGRQAEPAPDAAPPPTGTPPLQVNQGDIYWGRHAEPDGLAPEIPHPYVVIQENVLNHSRIRTVVACALTSNLKRAAEPGNVLLAAGEANLPKPSVVEVSKVSTLDKHQLGAYIGTLDAARIDQILAGMRFLHRSYFAR